jgi:hypothetical protein
MNEESFSSTSQVAALFFKKKKKKISRTIPAIPIESCVLSKHTKQATQILIIKGHKERKKTKSSTRAETKSQKIRS